MPDSDFYTYESESINLARELASQGIQLFKCGFLDDALELLQQVEKCAPFFTPSIAWQAPILDAIGDVNGLRAFYDYDRSIKIFDVQDSCTRAGENLPLAVARALCAYRTYRKATSNMPLINAKLNADVDNPSDGTLADLKGLVIGCFSKYLISARLRNPRVASIDECKLRMWATKVWRGGRVGPHYHPRSWLNAVFYPPDLSSSASNDLLKGGYLELGHIPPEMGKLVHRNIRRIPPLHGTVVVFPAYIGHAVTTVYSMAPRISLAFDLCAY